jgi:hypothetical protein
MKITHVCFVEDSNLSCGGYIKWLSDKGKIYNSADNFVWVVFHPIQFKRSIKIILAHIERNEDNIDKIDNWVDMISGETTEYKNNYKWPKNSNIKKYLEE